MKEKKLKLFLMAVLVMFCVSAFSQDKIYLVGNNDPIECEVNEIEGTTIFYTLPNSNAKLKIDKSQVDMIKYEGGVVLSMNDLVTEEEYYKDAKRNALKLNVLSPIWNVVEIAYEHAFSPTKSIEITAGYVGIGRDAYDDVAEKWDFTYEPKGFMATVGYKFMTTRRTYNLNDKYRPILQGGYIKPEFAFSYANKLERVYIYDDDYYVRSFKDVNKTMLSYSLMAVGGYQWDFSGFILDVYGGLGYGIGSYTSYGYLMFNDGFSVVMSAGVKLGFDF